MNITAIVSLVAGLVGPADGFPGFRMQEIDPHVGNVCYALTSADVDGDGKIDVVALSEDAVVWYRNPDWAKAMILKGGTEKDNVCIQPHDIDGDGRVDFAVGAAWRPSDTRGGGTLQFLTRTGAPEGAWRIVPVLSEPTLHRIRWGDVAGLGSKQLVVAPLQGRGTKGPAWNEGAGVRVLVLSPPARPFDEPWKVEVAADTLHTSHNLQLIDTDADGLDEILISAWEGVFQLDRDPSGRWTTTKLGEGEQATTPFKGASEIKQGRLDAAGRRYLATIEPWHGTKVVVYLPKGDGPLERRVIDEPVQWGHGVWCADLDGNGVDDLIIGQRDKAPESARGLRGPGVYVYEPRVVDGAISFTRRVIDDGGVAVEDLIAVDLDGDRRPEIVAGGRATHNVRIYWNGK
jgi:hypothetical protein